MKKHLIITIVLMVSSVFAFSHSLTDTIVGTWKGTSLCQVKSSPCNDEIAMYHVAKTGDNNIYKFTMNKIVNNKEEDMGILLFTYDRKQKQFTSENKERQAIWAFTAKGKTMKGTLMLKGVLYRKIDLTKID